MSIIYSQIIDYDFNNYNGFQKLDNYELFFLQNSEAGVPGFHLVKGKITLSEYNTLLCTRKFKPGRKYRITLKNAEGKGALWMGIDRIKSFDHAIPKDFIIDITAEVNGDSINNTTFSFVAQDDALEFSGYKVEYI